MANRETLPEAAGNYRVVADTKVSEANRIEEALFKLRPLLRQVTTAMEKERVAVHTNPSHLIEEANLHISSLRENSQPQKIQEALRHFAQVIPALDPILREVARDAGIKKLKEIGVSRPGQMIDAAIPSEEKHGRNSLQGTALMFPEPKLWHAPVEAESFLDEIAAAIQRYFAMPSGTIDTITLWILFAHAHDAFEVSPLLALVSPVKRCGKSTLLSFLSAVVPKPLPSANISPAVVFRVIELQRPTLLLDEMDARDWEDDMRGILNSGHLRSVAYVTRAVGDEHEPRQFSTWAPKVVALIGKLPETLTDRSIVIPMRRRSPDEKIERLRLDKLGGFSQICEKAARWVSDNIHLLCEADPSIPSAIINDRARDNWRPLLAIADAVGGAWPERARNAAGILNGAAGGKDDSTGIRLLADLRDMFEKNRTDRLSSGDIVRELGSMEDGPWSELKAGKAITTRQLAKLLEPFGVRPKTIRSGGEGTSRGYCREDFEDLFLRYLDPQSDTSDTSSKINALPLETSDTSSLGVSDRNGPNSLKTFNVSDVSDPSSGAGKVIEL